MKIFIPRYGTQNTPNSCLNSQGHPLWYINHITCSLIPTNASGNPYGGPYNIRINIIVTNGYTIVKYN